MLRLGTLTPPVAAGSQKALGRGGWRYGRVPERSTPGDDVIDLSLRVAMGALCVLTGPTDRLHVGCEPGDAPAGGLAFTDGVRKTSSDFQACSRI